MLGVLLGGAVIGGMVSNCIGGKRARRESDELELMFLMQQAQNNKLQAQITFFDEFRALDNQLARFVREGYKGVTYLIKAMEIMYDDEDMINAVKAVRNYRNRLSHDRNKWAAIPAPSAYVMKTLRALQRWTDENMSEVGRLVWKGKNAFNARRY